MKKPTLLIVNFNYPSESNLYGDVFVHSRLKQYISNFNIQVLGCNKKLKNDEHYEYEGINVLNTCSKKRFRQYLIDNPTDLMGIHFVPAWMFGVIKKYHGPVFIWVHGYEALGWYRRLFNFRIKHIFSFIIYMLLNTRQMIFMHRLINYSNKKLNIKFIFVSEWMRKITETDTFSKVRNYKLVPNPISEEIFPHQVKQPDQRKKVLLIRSFDSKKYANDIAIKAIEILSKDSIFSDMEFCIYGKGKDFYPLTEKVKKFNNIQIHNNFIEHKKIPNVHKDFGIFLCPTRQDAQGVSMCEAMSSGLVPITSNNTAIPEFVRHEVTGFLTNSPQEIADVLKELYLNPDKFLKISKQASESIREKSGNEVVIREEIEMMTEGLNNFLQ